VKAKLFILALLIICTGCHRELSVVKGVSVRPARYQGWGQSPGAEGLRLWGHTLADLAGRSVSLEAAMPEDRVISFLHSSERYDVVITGDLAERGERCRKMLAQTFGVCATMASREINVLVLVSIRGRPIAIKATKAPGKTDIQTWPLETCRHGLAALLPRPKQRVTHTFTSCDMRTLAGWLEEQQEKVVLDETNLSGAYDFRLIDDPRKGITIRSSLAALGLELQPARRVVSAVYVETTGQAVPVPIARSDRYSKLSRPWWAVRRLPCHPK